MGQQKKSHKDRPLGGLADALIKAGLVETAEPQSAEPASLDDVREAIRAHADSNRGGRRWYYVARDERVLFVDVSEATTKLLCEGKAGIVESLGGGDEHVVVTSPEALGLAERLDPQVVRFWNRHQG